MYMQCSDKLPIDHLSLIYSAFLEFLECHHYKMLHLKCIICQNSNELDYYFTRQERTCSII